MKRALLLLTALAGLGGCNLVYSETPLFSAVDARGAPQFRPGVWAQRAPGCDFDPARPIAEWPECADGTILTATHITEPGKEKDATEYVLAGGDPQVMQLKVELEPGKPVIYFYAGVRVDRTDAQGRIVEAASWIAQCGPPPPKSVEADPSDDLETAADAVDYGAEEGPEAREMTEEEIAAVEAEIAEAEIDPDAMEAQADETLDAARDEAADAGDWRPDDAAGAPEDPPSGEDALEKEVEKAMASGVTREPLPGLEIKDGMCLAREQGPVRAAVAASPAWEEKPPTVIYWVRDGDR